jgi:hypothetical protein
MDIFNITTEDNRVIVKVNLLPHNPKSTPRQQVATGTVVQHLNQVGVEFGNCLQEAYVNNSNIEYLSGTWIFEKKIEKLLDKPAEKVILSKEKKTLPNKKSKAKKKTSK